MLCSTLVKFERKKVSLALDQIRRIGEILQTDEVFLYAPRTNESVKYAHAACLVIRSAGSSTTKGLLADSSARTLFVIINVAGCITQTRRSLDEDFPVTSKDCTRQGILSGVVDQFECLVERGVVIDEYSYDWPEYFLPHGDRLWMLGEDHGRLDEESL